MNFLLRPIVPLIIVLLVGCATATGVIPPPEGAVSRVGLRLVPPYRMDLADDLIFDNQLLVDTVLGTLQDKRMVHPEGTQSIIVEVAETQISDAPMDDYIRGGIVVVDESSGQSAPMEAMEIRYQGAADLTSDQRMALMFQAIAEQVAGRMAAAQMGGG